MAVITTNVNCELQEAVKVQYLKGNLFSQDVQANVINVHTFSGGEPVTLSGTVTASVIREDGGTVTATGGTISGNVVSITLPAAVYVVPGLVSIVIKVTASSVITTIAAVVANVYKSSTDTAIDPGTIIPSVTALVAQIETAVASIPADYSSLWATLAPAFSPSKSGGYKVGEYVTYNGGLYICTTAHTGSWNASHFSAVNVGGELSRAFGAISFTTENGYSYLNLPISWINAYVKSTGVIASSSASITGLVTMHPGESVKIGTSNSNITIIGSTSASSIAVGDSVTPIQKTTSSGNYEEYTYTAQEQINIVLCVNKANYNILFYKESKFSQNIENEITALHGETFTETVIEKKKLKYNATNGASISASKTVLLTNFSAGEEVEVELQAESNIVSQYYLYFNGTLNGAAKLPNQKYRFTLTENLSNISFYCQSGWVTGTGSLVFEIGKIGTNNNSLEKTIGTMIDDVETAIIEGYFLANPTSNGYFTGAGQLIDSPNRIRTDFIPFKKNSEIIIGNGTFEHAVGMWNGEPSAQTNTRNDSSWITNSETIKFNYDGYIVIEFRKPNDSNISPSEFDGEVRNYNTFASVNGNSTYGELPEYYTANSYITNKVNRINELGKQSDDVFVFITDIHWELNAKNSPSLINYLNENCAIHKIFNGGDVADASRLDVYKLYRHAISGKTYHVAGNHDRFPPTDGKDLYYGMDSANNDQIGNAFSHYWYVDNVQQKIRYIVLNAYYHEGDSIGSGWTNYDAEQINWFSQTALDLPASDWDVVVFTHFLKTTSYVAGGADIGNAIDSFNSQSGHTGKILAVFQGHTHWDGIYHTEGGVPVITTTCDKWNLSNESSTIPPEGIAFREIGTIKEQAFDVVILNRDSRKFTCVRIGAPAQNNIDKYRTDSGFTWIGTLEEREITY